MKELILRSNELQGLRLCITSHAQKLTSPRTGAIPTSIGNLIKLTILYLNDNKLEGELLVLPVQHRN